MKQKSIRASVGMLAFLATSIASANLSFSLTNPDQGGLAGGQLTFAATIANSFLDENGSPSLMDLDGIQVNFTDTSPMTADSTPFYVNAPLTLGLPGSEDPTMPNIWTGDIFTIDIDPLAAPGVYSGVVDLLAEPSGLGLGPSIQGSAYFTVTVMPSSTPEPATMLILGSGLVVLARRRRR